MDTPRPASPHTPASAGRFTPLLQREGGRLVGGAGVVFFAFFVLQWALARAKPLAAPEYREAPSLLWATLLASPSLVVGTAACLIAFARTHTRTWSRLPTEAQWLRIPMVAALAAVAWHLGTVDANWALGRTFGLDRVVLVVLAVAAAFHPAFLVAFAFAARAFMRQFEAFFYFAWLDTLPVLHLMLVVFAWAALYGFPAPKWLDASGRWRVPVGSAWAVALGVLGAWYFGPGWGKVAIGWLWESNVAFMMRGAFEQHGLWAWLGAERFAVLAGWVERASPLLQALTLVAEVGVVLFCWSRRVTIGILALCAGMHLGIFATTGIFFWKWVSLLAGLIAAFALMGQRRWDETLPRRPAMAAVLLALAAFATFGPKTALAWYDSPFVYRFHVEVTGESGTRYEAVPATFAPFDSRFAQGHFYYLTETNRIADCFGSVRDYEAYCRLREATTPEEVRRVVAENGVSQTSEQRRRQLERFLRRFMASTHERVGEQEAPWYKAPLHIRTGQRYDATLPLYAFQEPIERLEMELVERHYFGGAYRVVNRERVLDVRWPEEEGGGGGISARSTPATTPPE